MKKLVSLVLCFLSATAFSQQILELTVSPGPVTLVSKPNAAATGSALAAATAGNVNVTTMQTSFKIKNPSNIKATITITPEESLNCPDGELYLGQKTQNASINTSGEITLEDGRTSRLGSEIAINVYLINGNDSTRTQFWKINTSLSRLTKCEVRREKIIVPGEAVARDITGIAYYDAIVLNNAPDKPTANAVLSAYAGTAVTSQDEAKKIFENNPYILDYLNNRYPAKDAARPQSLNVQAQVKNALSAAGGLDVTNIAHGFAKFLVKRTKEELNIAFFTRFKEELDKEEYKDLRTIFPHTFRALRAIGEDIYNYQSYMQTLRECFERDLAGILTTMPQVIDNHPEFFERQPELEAILRSGFYIAQGLQNKKHPGDILADYPVTYLDKSDKNFKAGVLTLQLFSKSLRYYTPEESDAEKNPYWIREAQLKKLYDDRNLLSLYLGLVQEEVRKTGVVFRANGVDHKLDELIANAFTDITSNVPKYETFIRAFAEKSKTVENNLEALKGIRKDSILVENYYSFFTSTINLLHHVAALEELPHVPDLKLRETATRYLDPAQMTCDMVIDVNRRNYGSAIVNAKQLLALLFETKTDETVKSLESDLSSAGEPEKKQLTFEIKSLKSGQEIMGSFFRYGTFMSSVVQAETPEEVEAAIEAFALPSGSSRIKRESQFNVALNAYVGLFTGVEKIKGVDMDNELNTFGLTAPIGISVSTGKHKFFGQGKGHWSYSLFVSLVDLGAVTAYRFKTTASDTATVEQVPTIQLKDIFSPGAFFSIGIPKSPVSINLGAQMGPNLRRVTTTDQGLTHEYSNSVYWRYSISVLVDIPILNFYTKTRKQ
jgi:hypothetical protein